VDVELRLLKLADSFTEETSRNDLDDFSARVFSRIGLPVPSETVVTTGGSDRPVRVGPPGPGGEREGVMSTGGKPEKGVAGL